jgi:hypothetical protein
MQVRNPARIQVRNASPEEGRSVLRIERNCLIEIAGGAVAIAFVAVSSPAIVMTKAAVIRCRPF